MSCVWTRTDRDTETQTQAQTQIQAQAQTHKETHAHTRTYFCPMAYPRLRLRATFHTQARGFAMKKMQ